MADVTAVLREERRLLALGRMVLLDTLPEAAFDRLTRLAARLLGVPVALVTLVDADRQFFKSCLGVPEPWAARRETPLSHSFCQHVVATAKPLVVTDAREHPDLRDNLAIRDLGAIAYAGFPLFSEGQPVGSFCAIDDVPREWSAEDLEVIEDLAAIAQGELDLRAAGRDALRSVDRAHRSSELLARLTALTDAVLGAADLPAMLARAAEELQRAYAADAVVAATGEGGPYASAGRPRGEGELLELGRLLLGRVRAVVAADDLGPHGSTWARAVLAARVEPGGLLVVGSEAPREWTDLERDALELGADRLAVSFERARLHDTERHVAATLQRALQPPHLPAVPGVALAARYEPAVHHVGGDWYDAFPLPGGRLGLVVGDVVGHGIDAGAAAVPGVALAARYEPAVHHVGGDWYDAFPLPGGRLGLAVGDVVGHGIDAGAAAVRLRHFLRGFVLEGRGPGGVLDGLDGLVDDEPHATFSSVVYAELDLGERTVRWASAGHVPPVLVRGGAARTLMPAGGTLLGARTPRPWPERTDALEPGDRLVLYTDGLVERVGLSLDTAVARAFTPAAGADTLEALCDALLAGAPQPRRDDVAILAAEVAS